MNPTPEPTLPGKTVDASSAAHSCMQVLDNIVLPSSPSDLTLLSQ